MTRISIDPAARKNGDPDERIADVWVSALMSCRLDHRTIPRELRIGFDEHGRDCEVIALVFDDDRVHIIHFMKARPAAYSIIDQARRRTR